MPEMTGLELQRQLNREGIHIPTIVITAHKLWAGTYLLKPLQDTSLLAAIDNVRAQDSRSNFTGPGRTK
jgi:FixJ family two-component response regulator